MDNLLFTFTGLNKWGNAFAKTVEYKLGMKEIAWGGSYGRYSLYLDYSAQASSPVSDKGYGRKELTI